MRSSRRWCGPAERGGSVTLPGLVASTGLITSTGLSMSTGTSIGISSTHRAHATSCRHDDQTTMTVEEIHLTGLPPEQKAVGSTRSSPRSTQRLRSRRQNLVMDSKRLRAADYRDVRAGVTERSEVEPGVVSKPG